MRQKEFIIICCENNLLWVLYVYNVYVSGHTDLMYVDQTIFLTMKIITSVLNAGFV